ncbi:MAG: mobile mystery protein B [Rickettsiales bacterium]|nr:mobile mystery protein B [Rickettsiales bacterium]
MPVFPPLEGATPIDDASGLKLKIVTIEALYVAEAENIAKAVLKYLAGKPSRRSAAFTVDWITRLHKEMYGHVWTWAGQVRTSGNPNIGVPAYLIQEELRKMVDDLHYWEKTGMDLVEQAVRLHHRAVWIHPFPNGNGRWSRMLSDIWLKQHGKHLPIWPAEMNRESPIRSDYIRAVKEADRGNFEPLLILQRRYMT